jgi:hypothetical protein
MTLSEAIRKGIPLVPATKFCALRFEADGKQWAKREAHEQPLVGADALGTALIGLAGDAAKAVERGYAHRNGPLSVLFEFYPQLTTKMVQCPDCLRKANWAPGKPPTILVGLLRHLTDVHDYTREQIADYLEGL